jgi:hypothetical protein
VAGLDFGTLRFPPKALPILHFLLMPLTSRKQQQQQRIAGCRKDLEDISK